MVSRRSEQGNVMCEVRNTFFHFFEQAQGKHGFPRSKSAPPNAKSTLQSLQTVGSIGYERWEDWMDSKDIDSVMIGNIPWSCKRENVAQSINERGPEDKQDFYHISTWGDKTRGYSSDLSTEYSPRTDSSSDEDLAVTPMQDPPGALSIAASASRRTQRPSQDSVASSLCQACFSQQDESMNGDVKVVKSSQPYSKARLQKNSNMDALNSAIHAALTTRLPAQCVSIEKDVTEESCKSVVFAEVQSSSRATSQCYDIMQQARQALTNTVSHLDAAILLSARVQREDFGYSLRASVACVPDSARDKTCWSVLRHGSCPKSKCCKWYHPQAADIMKPKISVARQDALNAKKSKSASNVPTAP